MDAMMAHVDDICAQQFAECDKALADAMQWLTDTVAANRRNVAANKCAPNSRHVWHTRATRTHTLVAQDHHGPRPSPFGKERQGRWPPPRPAHGGGASADPDATRPLG